MAKLLKITSMTPEEREELTVRKTDWWLVAKDVVSYAKDHENLEFVVWLNDKYDIPASAVAMLRKSIRRISGGLEIEPHMKLRAVNSGSKTKIGITWA
jgi:hypothetical protein